MTQIWVAHHEGEVLSAHRSRDTAREAVVDALVADGQTTAPLWNWSNIHSTKGNQELTYSTGGSKRYHSYVYAVDLLD